MPPLAERPTRSTRNRGLEAHEWKEFKPYISSFSLQDQADIEHAYFVAEAAHRGQYRRSGARYFSHPRECAIILLEAGVDWARPIILSLLHDVPEDTNWLERAYVPAEETRISSGLDRIAGSFDDEIAFELDNLTEIKADEPIISKSEAKLESYAKVASAGPDGILAKMVDRLHNLRTLEFMPRQKQLAKIRETKRIYIPIFKKILYESPKIAKVAGKLLAQIDAAMRVIEAELK